MAYVLSDTSTFSISTNCTTAANKKRTKTFGGLNFMPDGMSFDYENSSLSTFRDLVSESTDAVVTHLIAPMIALTTDTITGYSVAQKSGVTING